MVKAQYKAIDGFLGIKFGSTAAQVTEALKAKGGVINPRKTNDKELTFDNITLAGRKAVAVFIKLVNNQAYEAQFVFKPEVENKTIEYYNALVADITGTYGTGKSLKNFKQPYTDGDGYEITALKAGSADYSTVWNDSNNQIIVAITTNTEGTLRVRLFYSDGKLDAISENKQSEANKAEL